MVGFGFSWRDELVAVTDDGQMRVYTLTPCAKNDPTRVGVTSSAHYTEYSLGAEAAELGVAAVHVLPTRVVALTRNGAVVDAALPRAATPWDEARDPPAPTVFAPLSVPRPRLMSWAVCDGRLLLSTEAQLWTLDAQGYADLRAPEAPFVAMCASPNGKLLALLTQHKLLVLTSDMARCLCNWDMDAYVAHMDGSPAPPIPEPLDNTPLLQVAGRGGLGGTGVHALAWCGDNCVALAWPDRVVLVGPRGEPVELRVPSVAHVHGDAAGLRIVHAEGHEYVAKVDASTLAALRPGSTDAAALLLDAAQQAQRGYPRAYDAVHAMSADLGAAVDTCIDAAAAVWDMDEQRLLMQVRVGRVGD